MFALQLSAEIQTATAKTVLTYLDPLEQFDVLLLPLLGCAGVTNLALL